MFKFEYAWNASETAAKRWRNGSQMSHRSARHQAGDPPDGRYAHGSDYKARGLYCPMRSLCARKATIVRLNQTLAHRLYWFCFFSLGSSVMALRNFSKVLSGLPNLPGHITRNRFATALAGLGSELLKIVPIDSDWFFNSDHCCNSDSDCLI